MKKIIIFIFILFTINIFSSQSGITLKDLKNKEFSLDNYIGKQVVMLNFWATWCSPCKKELPVLNKLYNKYKDDGFMVLSVSLDDPSEFEDVRAFINSNKLTLPVLLDPDSECSDYYNPSKDAPFSILFDKSGKIVKKYLGFHSGEEIKMEKLVKSLLKENKKKKDNFDYRVSTKLSYTRYDPKADDDIFKNYELLLTRTKIFGAYQNYSLNASFHTNNFLTNTKYLRDLNYKFSDYRLEKITFKTNIKKQKIILGDYHITQGKGISLSLTKKDDLGIDTTLLGAKTDLKYKFIEATIFAGLVNNVNHDTDRNRLYDDKHDLIMGGTLKALLLNDSLSISLNYNRIAFKEPKFKYEKPENYKPQVLQVIGGNISYQLGKEIKTYFEIDTILDNYYNKTRRLDSLAMYGSLSYNFNKFTILHEFKKYKHFLIGFRSDLESMEQSDETDAVKVGRDTIFYNNLPTLERKGEIVYDMGDDIWGARTKVYYKLSKNIKPYFNYLYSYSNAEHKNRVAQNIYSGSEFYFKDKKNKVDISLGLRLEKEDFTESSQSDNTANYYGINFDTSFYINSYLSLDIKGFMHQAKIALVGSKREYDNFQDIETTISLALFDHYYISYLYNLYNTKTEKESDFHGMELKYKYKDWGYTKLFYGSIRGGHKCIGGVCKLYPTFKGLKVDLVLSF